MYAECRKLSGKLKLISKQLLENLQPSRLVKGEEVEGEVEKEEEEKEVE